MTDVMSFSEMRRRVINIMNSLRQVDLEVSRGYMPEGTEVSRVQLARIDMVFLQ